MENFDFCGQPQVAKQFEEFFKEQHPLLSQNRSDLQQNPIVLVEQANTAMRELGLPTVEITNKIGSGVKDTLAPIVVQGRRELINAANDNLGELLSIAAHAPAGRINVAKAFATADSLGLKPEMVLAGLGLQSDAKAIAQLRNIESIDKSPDGHVTIRQKAEQKLDLQCQTANGSLKDIRLDNTLSFDLDPNGGGIKNIRGVTLEGYGGLPRRQLNSAVEELQVTKDKEGRTVIRAQASNPEYFWERAVTGDHGKQISVDIQLQRDGTVTASQHGKKSTIARV